jgi:hypothetical protein
MKKPDGPTLFLGVAAVLASAVVLAVVWAAPGSSPQTASRPVAGKRVAAMNNPLDAARSYRYLTRLCELGPRFSGSEGMRRQQQLVADHFTQLGGQVTLQEFRVRHPLTLAPVEMANLVVHWHPERTERLLLCAHYDTRPFPDRDPDPQRRRDPFLGANDGASGVAVLMELGHLMAQFESPYGIDFVLFDGEELVYDDDRDPYFLGSRYFAQQYINEPPPYQYRGAVLLDMVGDKHLQLYQERASMSWSDTRPMVEDIWRTAEQLGVTEFIPRRRRYEIRDDHLMLHDIARIPACDIIDFDYGPPGVRTSYWHTRADTPDKCSGESLAKVGWVVWTWLQSLE